MPIQYTIHVSRHLILSTASGVVTASEIMDHQSRLMRDPSFDPTLHQIADFSSVARVSVTSDDIRLLAIRNFFAPQSRRCLVAPTSEIFGLARMFQLFREVNKAPEQMRVFRDRQEAMLWLFGDNRETD